MLYWIFFAVGVVLIALLGVLHVSFKYLFKVDDSDEESQGSKRNKRS